jgi:hypothetical protein
MFFVHFQTCRISLTRVAPFVLQVEGQPRIDMNKSASRAFAALRCHMTRCTWATSDIFGAWLPQLAIEAAAAGSEIRRKRWIQRKRDLNFVMCRSLASGRYRLPPRLQIRGALSDDAGAARDGPASG